MHNENKDGIECDNCNGKLFMRDETRSYLSLISIPSNDRNLWDFCDKICLQEWVNKSLPIKN